MRHAKSDAEKSKVDARYSDAARRERALERNVLAFPTLREIPEPDLPLREFGRKIYDQWTRRLLDAGMLTVTTVAIVERMAVAKDAIEKRLSEGKDPSGKFLEILRGAQLELKALNVDQPLGPDAGKPNKFSVNGFPARLRSA